MQTVQNPRPLSDTWDGHEIGDPFLMRHDGMYYLYCSSHGLGPGIKCWTSPDMETFTYYGYVCEDERIYGAYAPEVQYIDGGFTMVTSPVGSGHYILRADSPLGPFAVVSENLGLAIDGSTFVDDDGRGYFLRASHQGIQIHDMPAPDAIDAPGRVISTSYMGHWTEGPMIIKRDGRYFLTFTGNHVLSRGYRIAYCVSHDAPDAGYRLLREPVLLLETGDDFHALGHSSNCIGPDMDTYYIIYHNNVLDERNRPYGRSLNLDRLFFNGDRLYCNATWWPQEPPAQPLCQSRNGEGLVPGPDGLALPMETGAVYTAEVNLTLRGAQGHVFFSRKGDNGGWLTLQADGQYVCRLQWNGQPHSREGCLPTWVNTGTLMTIKTALDATGLLRVWVNGLLLFEMSTRLSGGQIGLDVQSLAGFMGFSSTAGGSEDGHAAKAIPGIWDALHYDSADGAIAAVPGEAGCEAVSLAPGQAVSYRVSALAAGEYHLAATMPGGDVLTLSCETAAGAWQLTAEPADAAAPDELAKRYLGVITVPQGGSTITLRAETAAVLDRLYLYKAEAFAPVQIVSDGKPVDASPLHIIGHKASLSMLPKYSGYTCAEGYGEAYFGSLGWRDYQVRATLYIDSRVKGGSASVYLRSRRESWHPHQISAARDAYRIHIHAGGIELTRQAYGETPLASAAWALPPQTEITLICRVQGSDISVYQETDMGNRLLLTARDPIAHVCGRAGIDAGEDGIGFRSVAVEAVEG